MTSSSIRWQCSDIHKKINGIRDDYRNKSYNLEAKLMRLFDDIHNFITEIVDVATIRWGLLLCHYDCQKIEKIV